MLTIESIFECGKDRPYLFPIDLTPGVLELLCEHQALVKLVGTYFELIGTIEVVGIGHPEYLTMYGLNPGGNGNFGYMHFIGGHVSGIKSHDSEITIWIGR